MKFGLNAVSFACLIYRFPSMERSLKIPAMFATASVSSRMILVLLLAGVHRGHSKDVNGADGQPRRSSSANFGYKHPEEWGLDFPTCSGSNQSPVDLRSKGMTRLDVPSPLRWCGYHRAPKNMTLQNNGHSVEVVASWDTDELIPHISGGVLDGKYAFAVMHFHWGPRNNVGSEHTINNHSFPLEMHMVHYKKEYGSFSKAQTHEDGLAVVGVLFQIGRKQNRGISQLKSYARSLKKQGPKLKVDPFPLSAFNVHFSQDYVAYAGSLTTPPCSEIVTWIVAGMPGVLKRTQMRFFRQIQLAGGDDHNYRPTMPRNGRTIHYIGY